MRKVSLMTLQGRVYAREYASIVRHLLVSGKWSPDNGYSESELLRLIISEQARSTEVAEFLSTEEAAHFLVSVGHSMKALEATLRSSAAVEEEERVIQAEKEAAQKGDPLRQAFMEVNVADTGDTRP